MATHEPDRSTRRRWFRMPGSQQPSPGAVQPDIASEPEASVSTEESPPEAAVLEAPVEVPVEAPVEPEPEPAVAFDEPVVAGSAGGTAEFVPGSDEPEPSPRSNGDSAEPASVEAGAAGSGAEPAAATDEIEPGMTLPRVISIANQKGGVGKTTTAVNLGAALGRDRVPGAGGRPRSAGQRDDRPGHQPPQRRGLDLRRDHERHAPRRLRRADEREEPLRVPATIDLAGAEIELVPAFSRELKLKRALQSAREDYDFTLIDCPPSLGLLTVNGLAASDDVVVPIQCEYYALEGLGQLLRNVALVKSNLNPELDVRGIVLTMYDARTRLAVQVEQEVREHFGPKVYRTVVPRTVRISEAPSFGEPIIVFDPTSRGAVAYRELAKEVSRGTARRAG